MTENILEVRNLVKDYGDFSLKQLNFDVPRGSIVGLIGENGAGKSTTINCILNEVQKNSGEILLFGKDYLQNEVENKNKIGIILLDVMMPKLDGWSVLRQIRQTSNVPIIMLTARGEEQDELFRD